MNRIPRSLEAAVQVVVLLATLLFLCSAVIYLYLGHWPVTHLDFWRIYDISFHHGWLETALLKVNNHSLFFPSFIWLADLRFFHGNQDLIFYAALLLLSATVGLILFSVWRDQKLSLSTKSAATLVVVVSNFWMGRAAIIASGGFNCSASLSMVGAILAFLFLYRIDREVRTSWLTFGILFLGALVSSLSSSTGLATLPTLVFIGWCVGLSWRPLGLVFLGGIVIAIIFVLLPDPLPSLVPSAPDYSFVSFTTFQRLSRLLGSPLLFAKVAWFGGGANASPVEASLFSLIVGAMGLIAAGALALPRVLKRNLTRGGMEYLGHALLVSSLIVMLMIVVGRAGLMRTAPSEVGAPRYFFWSSLFWVGLFMVLMARAEAIRGCRLLSLCGALCFLVFFFPSHQHEGGRYRFASIQAEIGALSLINDACDPSATRSLFHDPRQISTVAPELRRRNLDMFAAGQQSWIGKSELSLFGTHFRRAQFTGHAYVAKKFPCSKPTVSARLQGTVHIKHNPISDTLVVIDQAGVIRGIGRSFHTPGFANSYLYGSKFPGTSIVCYIPDYESESRYEIRTVEHQQLSQERIGVKPL